MALIFVSKTEMMKKEQMKILQNNLINMLKQIIETVAKFKFKFPFYF